VIKQDFYKGLYVTILVNVAGALCEICI